MNVLDLIDYLDNLFDGSSSYTIGSDSSRYVVIFKDRHKWDKFIDSIWCVDRYCREGEDPKDWLCGLSSGTLTAYFKL